VVQPWGAGQWDSVVRLEISRCFVALGGCSIAASDTQGAINQRVAAPFRCFLFATFRRADLGRKEETVTTRLTVRNLALLGLGALLAVGLSAVVDLTISAPAS